MRLLPRWHCRLAARQMLWPLQSIYITLLSKFHNPQFHLNFIGVLGPDHTPIVDLQHLHPLVPLLSCWISLVSFLVTISSTVASSTASLLGLAVSESTLFLWSDPASSSSSVAPSGSILLATLSMVWSVTVTITGVSASLPQ